MLDETPPLAFAAFPKFHASHHDGNSLRFIIMLTPAEQENDIIRAETSF